MLAPVYNRRGLFRELEKTLANCRRYGEAATVFYLDIDDFKAINDTRGHGAGDTVLQKVGEALSRATRLSDTVARIGGDEFVLILRHIRPDAAVAKAQALAATISGLCVEHEGETLSVRASIGFAEVRSDDTPHGVLARADRQMYEAKQNR